jgi:hypothetical protein
VLILKNSSALGGMLICGELFSVFGKLNTKKKVDIYKIAIFSAILHT